MPKAAQSITSQFKALTIEEQAAVLPQLVAVHEQSRAQRIKLLEAEMAQLRRKDVKSFIRPVVKKTRAKPQATHRSKKDRTLTWSGRGSMPRWMRDEMKTLKLKPDAFLIAKSRQ
ncbi:H-NS family nucleoid-associated regulatory protein [Bradyrhizobium sp. SYSU BS000235]|uniref:H-NS family nucleoid-associated regulatory protein n=1 Tax=Bradyrhizobium sp. SYSU BS000235 TaxID=3411332 RepID=UPI003C72C5D7